MANKMTFLGAALRGDRALMVSELQPSLEPVMEEIAAAIGALAGRVRDLEHETRRLRAEIETERRLRLGRNSLR